MIMFTLESFYVAAVLHKQISTVLGHVKLTVCGIGPNGPYHKIGLKFYFCKRKGQENVCCKEYVHFPSARALHTNLAVSSAISPWNLAGIYHSRVTLNLII